LTDLTIADLALNICYSAPKGTEQIKRNSKQRFDIVPVLEKISPYMPDKDDFLFP
jgi:hypothetical protein